MTPHLTAAEVGRVLVEALIRRGVSEFVISPGSRSAPLALAAAAMAPRVHVRVDERTAAFLALGLARGGGRPAAVICSSGTATANYHPAVIEADAAGVPLVVLTADRPVEVRGTGANQTIHQVGLYGSAVRWALDLALPDDRRGAEHAVRRAAATAVLAADPAGPAGVGSGSPGPVHLNVPLREPLLDGSHVVPERVRPDEAWVRYAHEPDRPPGDAPDVGAVLGGRRAVVVAGEGADADPGLLAAAARLAIPVLAEPTSGLRGPGTIRGGHWLAASERWLAAHRPDVVVQLGRPVLSRAITGLVSGAEAVVTVDLHGRGWDPGGHSTARLAQRFSAWTAGAPDGDPAWLQAWREADAAAGAALDRVLDEATGPTELGVARDLPAAMPDGSVLVCASSLPIRHLNEAMRPRDGLRVVGNRGASGIDGFTSTAVGVALGHEGPTAALAGDLSIVHDLTGLVIGDDEPRPSLPIVVLNNDGGGIFDLLPYGRVLDPTTFRRLFATPHGLPLEGVALTTGHAHTGVDDPAELAQALEDAWATPGITLLEVRTDTAAETARHHAVRAAVAEALAPHALAPHATD